MDMIPWYGYALGAGILTAINTIITKKALQKEHAMQFQAVQKLFLMILIIFFITKIEYTMPKNIWLLVIFIGIGWSIAAIYLTKAYRHMPISEASPLKNISPIFVLILAYLFLGEKPTITNIGGIGLIMIGAYALEADHNLKNLTGPLKLLKESKYVRYIIITLIIWAFTAIANKYVLESITPITLLFFGTIISGLITITLIQTYHEGIKDIKEGIKIYGWPTLITAIITILSDLAFFKAMTLAYVSLTIPIKRLSTLFETIIGGGIFHEDGILIKTIACMIMIIGAGLIVW